jgi:hypothetical protein
MEPRFLLAFTPASDLASLSKERKQINDFLIGASCSVHMPTEPIDVEFLKTMARGGAKNLVVFHYGGHANKKGLAYKDANGQEQITMTYEDLSQYMSVFTSLKLVFLNGCNSKHALTYFLNVADAVIYTESSVLDSAAFQFATEFYPNLLSNNDLDTACAVLVIWLHRLLTIEAVWRTTTMMC